MNPSSAENPTRYHRFSHSMLYCCPDRPRSGRETDNWGQEILHPGEEQPIHMPGCRHPDHRHWDCAQMAFPTSFIDRRLEKYGRIIGTLKLLIQKCKGSCNMKFNPDGIWVIHIKNSTYTIGIGHPDRIGSTPGISMFLQLINSLNIIV